MFNEKELERKVLINEVNDFWEIYKLVEDVNKKEFIYKYLVKLEEILNQYNCEYDDRFVTYGRRDFLKKELSKTLSEGKDNSKLSFAFKDLYEYILCDTWISPSSVPNRELLQETIKKDDAYREEGIICKQEKEILLDMILELKNAIKETDKNVENVKNMNIFIEESSWGRGNKSSKVIKHKYKINLNQRYVVKTKEYTFIDQEDFKIKREVKEFFAFIIKEIGDDYIIIRTNRPMKNKKNGGIFLGTQTIDFKIKVNEVTKLVTPTMDFGYIFKISLV